MCGICGLYSSQGASAEDYTIVRNMMSSLEHRGPDGEGFWAGEEAVLGHRRLAIIDLAGGWQPIFNETRDVGVIQNGEIFNYRELRRELVRAGHCFRTASDTEVIVHGYEEWGDDFVTRLRGMFAFALWDAKRRRMLLVRDRFGVKPLYYAETDGGTRLLFASEIKALFVDPRVPRALNSGRLAEYLAFRSLADEETMFEGVHEVMPGNMLVLENGRKTERRYWSPQMPISANSPTADVVEQGRKLLVDSVEARLVSDVDLGTITSGGLDSSLLSAITSEIAGRTVDTFCVGFEDPRMDERPYGRMVAERIKSRHHEIIVHPEEIDLEIEQLTWANDEPLTHPNSVPMHFIFRDAKENIGVTVLLSGEGADEVFGGYGRFRAAARRDKLRRTLGFSLVKGVIPPVGKFATLKKVLRDDYLLAASEFSDRAVVASLTGKHEDYLQRRRSLWPGRELNADGLFVYDQRTYLLPLLQRQDRMSMAAGLEVRVPYLDHHLAEWANSLGADVKLAGGVPKALLRAMATTWLPGEIINRRKVGFEMPLGQWMRPGGPLAHRVAALRDKSSFSAEHLDRRTIQRLIEEHTRGQANHADTLWTLIALDTWASVFLRERVRGQRLPGAATGKMLPLPEVDRQHTQGLALERCP